MRELLRDGVRLHLVQGDITTMAVDAIVNAANSALRGGGGVDGAIHRAGGPTIMAECRRLGGCPTGEARITTAGKLPARFVIHPVVAYCMVMPLPHCREASRPFRHPHGRSDLARRPVGGSRPAGRRL